MTRETFYSSNARVIESQSSVEIVKGENIRTCQRNDDKYWDSKARAFRFDVSSGSSIPAACYHDHDPTFVTIKITTIAARTVV